jgi:DNA-binding CsgD family transcriptional regulator
MYGFTNCESQLAALLARGTTLSDAALQLGVSINTVKTHLRGIYEKMGTNKQAQVVAQLNHSTARLL